MTDARAEQRKPWTIAEVLRWATDDFRSRSIENPRLDAEVLLAFATHSDRVKLFVELTRELGPDELARFRELVQRRRTREPVAYLIGEREFYGRPFRVDARVLIPRPDTETLVEVALARTKALDLSLQALDLCTGSGCVAISIAKERPTSRMVVTDVSADALQVARENALRLGAYNLEFRQGNLFEALAPRAGSFDLITANPPYIPDQDVASLAADIRAHEPHIALSGGSDGLFFYRAIAGECARFLAPGGVIAVEVGAGQAPSVAALFASSGLDDLEIEKDLLRIERVVSAKKPS